jgi:hypothetical protein
MWRLSVRDVPRFTTWPCFIVTAVAVVRYSRPGVSGRDAHAWRARHETVRWRPATLKRIAFAPFVHSIELARK